MSTNMKRAMITLLPEWEEVLIRLKKEKFYNVAFSEMYRVLMGLGIEVMEKRQAKKEQA